MKTSDKRWKKIIFDNMHRPYKMNNILAGLAIYDFDTAIDRMFTEHDQEIIKMIDEMIEKERSLSEGDMTYDATDLLTEIRSKL